MSSYGGLLSATFTYSGCRIKAYAVCKLIDRLAALADTELQDLSGVRKLRCNFNEKAVLLPHAAYTQYAACCCVDLSMVQRCAQRPFISLSNSAAVLLGSRS